MGTINWGELFPGRWSLVIFISYMALFVNQGIIVTWSQRNGHYEYNIVMVVLMTEVLKLIASVILYCKDNSIISLWKEVTRNKRVLLLYTIPSFLYCLYNNLAFINLAVFDPTTYYVLLQFRVVMTGIIFQVVFNKKLSLKQWFSLIILTIGCMVKHVDLDFSANMFSTKLNLNSNIMLIFVQTICSCLAGVYNEYLLKEQGANINMFVQNVFMYIDSIFCNLIVFAVLYISDNSTSDMFNNVDPSILLQPKVIIIMLNNTAIGIITSFFLKNLNSILKTFASALELVFTAVLCWLIFSIPILVNTVISITMVSYAVILYSQNPVQNTRTKDRPLLKVDSIV
ncbi:PREDICTED: CMP-sialic acid transporter 1 [Dufourea novaeangliae]|uniref:CMP-sialic acid transporter 1 n=1 Tax=Dufourea novaeangliae TaxID=178035 RepID=A0A154PQ36_DUFNO|nr:PREDICTED: CMP-sialic acid transporter 1 [Dufourea novaeangliae]KZC14002.1 CMP-sialic acid transporter 1 [Dufourea novaeangliae]